MSTRVIIADDHTIVREGLKAILEQNGIEVSGLAKNGREAVSLSIDLKPDVVMMDISMPDLNGVEATAAILKKLPGVRIIALSMHSSRKMVDQMFASGASGYLLKDGAFNEIFDALQEVKKGRYYLTPVISRMYVDGKDLSGADWENVPKLGGISAKERQVLQLVAEGEKTRAIAEKLHISHKTVETHRRNIMKKLHIFSIAGLTKFAIKEGISSLE